MKWLAKKLFPFTPKWLRRALYGLYERHYASKYPHFSHTNPKGSRGKKSILFYHTSGLTFGGTEKFLQIVAKNINRSKYDVFFMYSPKIGAGRKEYILEKPINLIPFDFKNKSHKYPFYLEGMDPQLGEVINKNYIDIIVTAGSGYSEYPLNTVDNTPIIMINIFGSPSTKKNIVKQISISNEVQNKVLRIVPKEKCEVMYIPSEGPTNDSESNGQKIRLSLGLHQDHMLFGRIGRASDEIFDPIGILAFEKIVRKYPHAHYLIVSPPPALIKIVKTRNIPNVHFIQETSDEETIWAFHFAIDVLAHFRKDGESCGLNIIESMIASKPIITHRSPIWNAHLEYLDLSFARIGKMNDVEEYASYMEEFILLKEKNKLKDLGLKAKVRGEQFLIKNNIKRFESWIAQSIVE